MAGERFIHKDYTVGFSQRKLILGITEKNPDGTYRYSGRHDPSLLDSVYNTQLSNPGNTDLEKLKRRYERLAVKAVDGVVRRLKEMEEGIPHIEISQLLGEIRQQPGNENMTPEELLSVLREDEPQTDYVPKPQDKDYYDPYMTSVIMGKGRQIIRRPVEIFCVQTKESIKAEDVLPLPSIEAKVLGNTERTIYSMMLISPDLENYLYPTIEKASDETFKNTRSYGKNRGKIILQMRETLRSLMEELRKYQKSEDNLDEPESKLAQRFLSWAGNQDLYSFYSVSELIEVLERNIAPSEIVRTYREAPKEPIKIRKKTKSSQNQELEEIAS